jgi:hypothetical protein
MFILFFRSGVVNISYLDKVKTKDYQIYIEVWLKALVSTLKEKKTMHGTKNPKFDHFNARPHVQKEVKKYL